MIIAGRYELGEPLGFGGEARVFRAHDRATGSEIAVRLTAAPEGELHVPPAPLHPAWVRLLDRGHDPEHGSFAVFELLHGETLGAMIARQRLNGSDVGQFARQSLDAVGALHEAGWVHGDLNANNFLLEAGTSWKLLELPFHRAPPPANRSPLFGSIYTLAPEQIAGQPPDARSDLFALGCLFYYAASGRYPHGEESAAEIAIGRLRFAPIPLTDLVPGLAPGFAEAIRHLLARDPAERPPTAEAACQLLGS